MAIVEMQKVAIIAHRKLKQQLVDRLHNEGVLQITPLENTESIAPAEKIDFKEADIAYAIEALTKVASKQTLANIQKRSKNPKEIKQTVEHTDINGIIAAVRELELSDTEAQKTIQSQQQMIDTLSLWGNLPYPLNQANDSKFTVRLTGTLPNQQIENALPVLRALPLVSIETLDSNGTATSLVAIVEKKALANFEQTATQFGWSTVKLPTINATAKIVIEEARLRILTEQKLQEDNQKKRSTLAIELPNLYQAATYVRWLSQKSSAHGAMVETIDTVTLFGWMPKKKIAQLEAKLEKECTAVTIIKVKPEAHEEAPVYLQNPKWLTPFESVTTLYGLPLNSEMDPTVALSPFFILFFALCLTDSGYGLTIAAIFGIYLLLTKQSVHEAKLPWLLFISGIVTFFVSIPFGGWFGIMPNQVPEFLTKETAEGVMFKGQIWNLNKESGITFLQNLALAFGLTHLFFGMFLAGYHKWVHGNKAGAFWQDFTNHLLFAAAVFLYLRPEPMAQVALYTFYIVLALTIWGKGYGNPWYLRPIFGVLGLVNFGISLLSNGLSYLRILALGLVTGAIAMAVNQVAVEIGNLLPTILKIPTIVAIFLVGHLVSIALNTLGSFIHSGRLQFIEFFSQFFEGGGQGYNPFRRTL